MYSDSTAGRLTCKIPQIRLQPQPFLPSYQQYLQSSRLGKAYRATPVKATNLLVANDEEAAQHPGQHKAKGRQQFQQPAHLSITSDAALGDVGDAQDFFANSALP